GKAGDGVALIADAARHDGGKMREVRIDVERHTVQGHPLLHADTNSSNLVLVTFALFGSAHQTPMRSSRPSPRTLKAARLRMIHSSNVATNRRTSRPRCFRSSIT